MQLVFDVQATPFSAASATPRGFEILSIVQALPFQRSAMGDA
jgi:hypothetical protein